MSEFTTEAMPQPDVKSRIDSPYNACMHRDECRANAADLARLTAELERKQRECEGLREDAERWRRWLPWLHQVKRLPFDLAVELKQIREAALSAGEKNDGHA